MITEGKSNLLFYIGSIVQTVLGNLKGQNVIVMYHPRKPLMTKVDIYQVRDKHKDHQTKLSSSSHLILSHISVRRLLLPSTIVAWSSRLSGRGLLWPEVSIFQHSGFRKYLAHILQKYVNRQALADDHY